MLGLAFSPASTFISSLLEQAVKISDDYEKLAGGINNIIVNQTVSK